MSLDDKRMPGSPDSPRLPDESMEYLREFSDAPGVAEGGGERNHYCMNCHGLIPLCYDSRESSDQSPPENCPHCGVALEGNVRMMFNWVEMDQVPQSDARALLPWAIAGLLFLGALGFLLWWLLAGSFAGEDKNGPSVLLITIDTCRADHLSTYGYDSPTTPQLNRLAARGRRYERAYSASSSTSPSHASIFTGRYPSWHSVGVTNGMYELISSELTLAETVAQHGWRTGAVISNPVLRSSVGFSQGFDTYDEEFEGVELNRGLPERYSDQAVDLALDWLSAVRGQRFFFWLHLQDPHGPYSPPEGWPCEVAATEDGAVLPAGRDQSGFRAIPRYQLVGEERAVAEYRRRYDCEIAFTDHHLGRLFEFLEADASFAETLVVLTADHGEAFGEDDFYFVHGHSVGLDQVHVPLILAGPGVPPGETISTPVSNVAVFATVLDYLGLEPSKTPTDAPSLFSAPTGEAVFVESPTQVGVVTESTYMRRDRLPPIQGSRPPGAKKALGRFWRAGAERTVPRGDLDPEAMADSLERARGLLADHDQRAHGTYPELGRMRKRVVFTPSELETLRKLGYVE